MTEPTRVLIVDDHPLFLDGLTALLTALFSAVAGFLAPEPGPSGREPAGTGRPPSNVAICGQADAIPHNPMRLYSTWLPESFWRFERRGTRLRRSAGLTQFLRRLLGRHCA